MRQVTNHVKRSMRIAGHRTSIALEPEFWAALEIIARQRVVTMPMLAATIDASKKPDSSLASACRVFVLDIARSGNLTKQR